MALVLTMRSVLMCPHGGMISPVPVTPTAYRVDGYRPLLFSDVYAVIGCPFSAGPSALPCQTVNWLLPSNFLTVKGIPVLTSSSIGMTVGGVPSPVVIAAIPSTQEEPKELTNIDY